MSLKKKFPTKYHIYVLSFIITSLDIINKKETDDD